jgi:hypothetical protein
MHGRRRFHRARRQIHDAGDPRVPVTGCLCVTCDTARDDIHGEHVAVLLGEADRGICRCGRGLDELGRCIAWWQCPFSSQSVAR